MLRMVVLVAGILLASGADAKTPCTPKRLGVGLGGGNLLSGVSVKKCLTKDRCPRDAGRTGQRRRRRRRLHDRRPSCEGATCGCWGVGADGDCVLWQVSRRSLDRRQRRGGWF